MPLKKILGFFSKVETVPVELDDVVAQLRHNGVEAEVYYFPADIDPNILRGQLNHWEYPDNDGGLHSCVDIEYSKHLDEDWQRIVVCKELLHILDGDAERTDTPEKIKHLIDRIVLPPDLREPEKDGLAVLTDRIVLYIAVAILFPLATRELLKPKFDDGTISLHDISRLLCLPLRFVVLVMNDAWENEIYPVPEAACD